MGLPPVCDSPCWPCWRRRRRHGRWWASLAPSAAACADWRWPTCRRPRCRAASPLLVLLLLLWLPHRRRSLISHHHRHRPPTLPSTDRSPATTALSRSSVTLHCLITANWSLSTAPLWTSGRCLYSVSLLATVQCSCCDVFYQSNISSTVKIWWCSVAKCAKRYRIHTLIHLKIKRCIVTRLALQRFQTISKRKHRLWYLY